MTEEIEKVLKVIKSTKEINPVNIDWIEKRGMSINDLYTLSIIFFKEYKIIEKNNNFRFCFPLNKLLDLYNITEDDLNSLKEQIINLFKVKEFNLNDYIFIVNNQEILYDQLLCYVLSWIIKPSCNEIKFAQSFFSIDYIKSDVLKESNFTVSKENFMKLAKVIKNYNIFYSNSFIDFNNIFCTQVKTEIDYFIEQKDNVNVNFCKYFVENEEIIQWNNKITNLSFRK